MEGQLVVSLVVMMIVAVAANPISQSDEACMAKFKSLANQHYKPAADIESFLGSVEVDWEQLFKEGDIGEEIFKPAAEKHGRPEAGCKKVSEFVAQFEEQVSCVDDLDFEGADELVQSMMSDPIVQSFWKANIACSASE